MVKEIQKGKQTKDKIIWDEEEKVRSQVTCWSQKNPINYRASFLTLSDVLLKK